MKKRTLYIAMSAIVTAGMLASCSSDYLDVAPKTDISEDQLSDPSAAKSLVGGIYEAMNVQYTNLSVNQNVGEANINMNCGEAAGTDFNSGLWTALPGLRTWSYISDGSSYMTIMPWMYYYNIINLSNYLIKAIPATSENHEGTEGAMLLYKAEALTMRAHGYTRLLGYYGNRWEDSDNGETKCIVIRTTPGTEPTPLRTMNEVLALIYEDLDEAIKLYDLSGSDRSAKYEANKSVANGIWARAALIKHDWQTAADKAHAAREGYTIMEEKDLFAGFFTDNSEVMWSMNPTETTTYYWSWGSHYACNGAYVNNWQIGAGAINIDLYNKAKAISAKDLRLKFFWTPDKLAEIPRSFNPGGMKEADFWNPDVVDASNILNMAATNVYDRTGKDEMGIGMLNCLGWWLNNYREKVFTGSNADIANDDNQYNSFILDYTGKDTKKAVRLGRDANGNNMYAMVLTTPFGVQNKFWSYAPYGNMAMPWMRASEMALTEAEAYYMLGNQGAALAALNEVQSKRIPGYTSSASGQALLDEIKTSRRIELWGEGFCFLDLKRWNTERVRRIWKAGDPTSGNCVPDEQAGMTEADVARVQSTKYCNGWRFMIPQREYQYNDAIDMSELKMISND